ncbi:MAG: hypothetical protein Q7T05_05140 [Dehalococcoidia bacterium]|nr:hypothetical protein [Dehalococcoidia bacterium]
MSNPLPWRIQPAADGVCEQPIVVDALGKLVLADGSHCDLEMIVRAANGYAELGCWLDFPGKRRKQAKWFGRIAMVLAAQAGVRCYVDDQEIFGCQLSSF